jgi:hypothetical protein
LFVSEGDLAGVGVLESVISGEITAETEGDGDTFVVMPEGTMVSTEGVGVWVGDSRPDTSRLPEFSD